MKLAYFAYPLDFATADDHRLIQRMANKLVLAGFVVYDPGMAFHGTANHSDQADQRVTAINDHALNTADVMLALLPPGATTLGVPMEIERARARGIPVAVVGAEGSYALTTDMDGIHKFLYPGGVDQAADWLKGRANLVERQFKQAFFIKITHPDGKIPKRSYPGDAGYDLVVSETKTIPAGEFVDIDCGISIEMGPAHWASIVPRSSTLRKRGLLVAQGVIDSGYRGPIYSGVWNLTDHPVTVEAGERVAQLIPMELVADRVEPIQVVELSPSRRAAAGFGSSGA